MSRLTYAFMQLMSVAKIPMVIAAIEDSKELHALATLCGAKVDQPKWESVGGRLVMVERFVASIDGCEIRVQCTRSPTPAEWAAQVRQ